MAIIALMYLLSGKPPHPVTYGLLLGYLIGGAITFIVFSLSNIDAESKGTMFQILMLNVFIGFTGDFFYKQNSWGGINVFGHNLSGIRGTYDYLPALSAAERANVASMAISNFTVSVIGAFIVSFCVYLLNRYLVTHYKIAGAKSFPQLLATLMLLVLISSSAYGSYIFFERYSP